MYIFFQVYQLLKRNIYFFIPIQVIICILNLYLFYNSQDKLYVLYIPLCKARGLLEIMILNLNLVSILFSLYIYIGTEFSTFASLIFVRTTKIKFILIKNIVLFFYSIIMSVFCYFEYSIMVKYTLNIILDIRLLKVYIIFFYTIYLLAYIIALLFESNNLSIIILISVYIYIIYNNINIIKYFYYVSENSIVILLIIGIINTLVFIILNNYNKSLKKGSV